MLTRFKSPGMAIAGLLALLGSDAGAQSTSAEQKAVNEAGAGTTPDVPSPPNGSEAPGASSRLLQVPVSGLIPGNAKVTPDIQNPDAGDPEAAQRGMRDFSAFNCVGCHMGNGGGGMGPALSTHNFIYGSAPANIYLSIVQGRPNGMPAWGTVLPQETIWDLVTYIQSLSDAPTPQWGQTVSAGALTIEQVPAEIMPTDHPWNFTEKFKSGQKP